MGTEKEMGTGTEIEWLSELQRELNVKRGKKELNVKITVRLGYTERNDVRREIMYMEANVYDGRTGKLISKVTRTAEDGTLSVVHIELLMDFYNSVINELFDGNKQRKAISHIDRWL
jgi:hypothetical protein